MPRLTVDFSKGIMIDPAPIKLPEGFCSNGKAIRFRDGYCEKMRGNTDYYTIADANYINGLYAFKAANGTDYLMCGTKTSMTHLAGGSKTVLSSAYTGHDNESVAYDASPWSFTSFGAVLIFSNGIDPIQKLVSPYSSVAALGGTPPTAGVVRTFKRHVVLLAMPTAPKDMRWSDIDDYEMWTAAPDNEAGQYTFYDSPTWVVGGDILKDYLAVYTQNQIYLVQYVGGTYVMSTRLVVNDVGLWKKNLLVSVEGLHYFMARDNFYVFDGTKAEPIGTGIYKTVFDSLNTSQMSTAFAFPVKQFKEIWFVLPMQTGGNPNLACIYNYEHGGWSFKDMNAWAGIDAKPTLYPVYSDENKKVQNLGITDNANGAAIDGWVDSAELDMGDPIAYKMVLGVTPEVDTSASIVISHGTRNREMDSVSWTDYTYNYAAATAPKKIDIRKTARYHRFRVRSASVDSPWKLINLEVDYELMGIKP